MSRDNTTVFVGSFACEFGDVALKPLDIPSFEESWAKLGSGEFESMGCETFCKMSEPVDGYIVRCIQRALVNGGELASNVDYVVFATSDSQLRGIETDFVARCLAEVGLDKAVPVLLGLQQCCGSISALEYSQRLVVTGKADTVVLVAFDYTERDDDRITPFALFGDAVTACLVTREGIGELEYVAAAVSVDHAGLQGNDSFASRQTVAKNVLAEVVREHDITRIFTTNLFKPITIFNATVAGMDRTRLHYAETLKVYGHCGNCDWMINLVDYTLHAPLEPGQMYLAQSSAPGFFAAAQLKGRAV